MNRNPDFFQRVHQTLQAIRQRDGRSRIGQQEGAGDQHQNTSHHKNGTLHALGGNGQAAQPNQNRTTIGVKQIQNTREQQNEHNRLHAADDGFWRDCGYLNGNQQKCQHNRIGNPAGCHKQRHDVHNQNNQLGTGIQTVNGRISREILPQCNVFKHRSFLPSAGSVREPPAPWYRHFQHPNPSASDTEKPG